MMKTTLFFTAGLFCLFVAPLSPVSAENGRPLASFKAGFFYASVSKDEGVVQLSDCAGNGYRCAANGSLDVVFVFKTLKECNADRDKTLNSEEE